MMMIDDIRVRVTVMIDGEMYTLKIAAQVSPTLLFLDLRLSRRCEEQPSC